MTALENVMTVCHLRERALQLLNFLGLAVRVALAIADRAYVLEVGRIALSGRGGELPGNPRVQQAYLGL